MGSDHNGWIHALDTVFPIFTASCAASNFLRWLFPIVALGSTRVRAAFGAFNQMIEVAEDCVRARQHKIDCGEDIGRIDMLAKLFDIKEAHAKKKVEGANDSFPFASIVQESSVGIFAGSDTTAIALRIITYHLMKHIEPYRKLRSEIDAAVESGNLLRDTDGGYIRYADAIRLPYLQACCKEGMRLHPSVSMSMPRHGE
jgi:cytochrome P450